MPIEKFDITDCIVDTIFSLTGGIIFTPPPPNRFGFLTYFYTLEAHQGNAID